MLKNVWLKWGNAWAAIKSGRFKGRNYGFQQIMIEFIWQHMRFKGFAIILILILILILA